MGGSTPTEPLQPTHGDAIYEAHQGITHEGEGEGISLSKNAQPRRKKRRKKAKRAVVSSMRWDAVERAKSSLDRAGSELPLQRHNHSDDLQNEALQSHTVDDLINHPNTQLSNASLPLPVIPG